MKNYLLIYGGNTLDGEIFDEETILRFKKVFDLLESSDKRFTIILAAGKRPGKPFYRAQKMVAKDYLDKLFTSLANPPVIQVLDKDAWSTFEETVIVAKALKDLQVNNLKICSTWTHLLRILIIWTIVAPQIKIKLIGSKSIRPIRSIIWEIGGFVKLFQRVKKWREK